MAVVIFCPPTTRVCLETGVKEIGPIGDSRLRKLMNGFSDRRHHPRLLGADCDTRIGVLVPLQLQFKIEDGSVAE